MLFSRLSILTLVGLAATTFASPVPAGSGLEPHALVPRGGKGGAEVEAHASASAEASVSINGSGSGSVKGSASASSSSSASVKGDASVSAKGQAGITTALKTCTKKVSTCGDKLKKKLKGCNKKDSKAIVTAVAEILMELHAAIKVAASVCGEIAGKGNLTLEVGIVASLIANLLNAVFAALLPLQALIASAPGLVFALAAHLLPLILSLVSLCHSLFLVNGALLVAVKAHLHANFASVFKSLGCSSLVWVLQL